MSLTYATLKTAVLSNAHRPALTTEVVDFVRQAEGLIRRELRAFELRTTLVEADRVAAGLYDLPSTLLEVRAIQNQNGVTVEPVGLSALNLLTAASDVLQYALSLGQVEFRGVPGLDEEITVIYFGWPDELSQASDHNELLDLHERIYIDGALAYLYEWTEDTELADRAMNRCMDAIERVNQQKGRRLGGTSVAGRYNLGNFATSTGY